MCIPPVSSEVQQPGVPSLQGSASSIQHRVSSRPDHWLALLASLAAFALFLRTLAPGLLWGDSAEFQFAAWLGGFAHPTGYPLYLMLGWLWTHALPWGDPAWRMNLFSAVWGGVAVGLVYLVVVRALRLLEGAAGWSAAPFFARLVALCAAATFAVTPTFWSQAVIAEVYTLHAAFVAALLLVLLAWAERSVRMRACALYCLALLCGLSLAHHRTTLLLLPAIAVFLWLARRPAGVEDSAGPSRWSPDRLKPPVRSKGRWLAEQRIGRRVVVASALFLAPLLLYLYIPLRAPQASYFQLTLGPDKSLPLYSTTLTGFLEHISGSTFSSALGGRGDLGAVLSGLVQRFVRELTWPGLFLGLAGVGWFVWLAVRPAEAGLKRNRAGWLILTLLAFFATVGFNLFYGIGDIYVFYIPAYLIWALWLGAGVWVCGRVAVWACRRVGLQGRGLLLVYVLVGLLAFLLPGSQVSRSFAANDRSREVTSRDAWESILAQPIPQDAILVSNDRDEMVPQWYLKYVENRRPDLDGLFPLIQPGAAWSDVAAVVEQALATGRPVCLIKPMPGLEVKFDLEPITAGDVAIGNLVRVLGPASRGETAQSSGVTFGEQLRLDSYEVQPATVSAGHELTTVLYWEALTPLGRDYTTFVHLVNATGTVVGQSDHQPGGVYYPTSLWRPGDRLRDAHRFVIAADPGAGPYALEVGVYRLAPDLQHLGGPQQVGALQAGD